MVADNQLPGQVANTLLVLSFDGIGESPGVNPYSARGLHQSLNPIAAVRDQGGGGGGILRRTVNGKLVDVSAPQMRKYRSEISCNDQAPPAIDGLWAGMIVQVSCAAELGYLTLAGAQRPVVSGSERVEGDFTYYRPQLTMMVCDFQVDKDEWGATTSWQLVLEEV